MAALSNSRCEVLECLDIGLGGSAMFMPTLGLLWSMMSWLVVGEGDVLLPGEDPLSVAAPPLFYYFVAIKLIPNWLVRVGAWATGRIACALRCSGDPNL